MSDNVYKVAAGATWSHGTVYWRFFLVLAYAGTIFALSSIPGKNLPSVAVSDKLLHAVEFGGFTFLLCRALHTAAPAWPRRTVVALGVLVAVCYGAGDEAHQLLVAQRVAELADLVADGVGALLAAGGWWWAGTRWPWIQ